MSVGGVGGSGDLSQAWLNSVGRTLGSVGDGAGGWWVEHSLRYNESVLLCRLFHACSLFLQQAVKRVPFYVKFSTIPEMTGSNLIKLICGEVLMRRVMD